MVDVLRGDVAILIIKKLSFADACSFCYAIRTQKNYRVFIYDRLAVAIDDILKIYMGVEYFKFKQLMIASKSCISGSLPLRTMVGAGWQIDVDFFGPHDLVYHSDYHSNLYRFFVGIHNSKPYDDSSYGSDDGERFDWRYPNLYDERELTADEVFKKTASIVQMSQMKDYERQDFRKPVKFIDHIELSTLRGDFETMAAKIQFFREKFDMAIVKNFFYYDDEGQPHVYVDDLWSIMRRSCPITMQKNTNISEQRIFKYRTRGFNIY